MGLRVRRGLGRLDLARLDRGRRDLGRYGHRFCKQSADRLEEEIERIPESEPNKALDDCEISCVDWYGSLRPFFVDGRIFALLDYELVEAEIRVGRLREIQRAAALRD